MTVVQLDDDAVGHPADSRQDTHAASRYNLAVFRYVGSLDDSHVYLTQEPVAQVLCQFGEVHVEVLCPVSIQQRTQVLARLVRCTELDCIRPSQRPVQLVAGRSSRKHPDLERVPFRVFFFCLLCDGARNDLRAACRRKTTEAHVVIVMNVSRSFFSCYKFQCHDDIYYKV